MLLIALLVMLSAFTGFLHAVEPMGGQILAAMSLLDPGMTRIWVSAGAWECQFAVYRALSSRVLVLGTASTTGALDLELRVLLPEYLAPAFLAIGLAPQHITGLMTLFFGPISIDLGRRWGQPARWAWLQLSAHPRLSLMVGIQDINGQFVPSVGWRLFPTGSASWDIELAVASNEMRLTVGGVF